MESGEDGALLPRSDRRHEHLRKVLKKGQGDEVDAGLAWLEPFAPAPGSLGKAKIERLDDSGLVLSYEAEGEAPPLAPIRLILGFPRPIQATRIFKDLSSLGVADLRLTGTELGEKSYLESSFFRSKEYRRPLLEGAEQAANPRLPRVSQYWTLARCLDALCDKPNAGDRDEPDWASGAFIALHPDKDAPNLGAFRTGAFHGGPHAGLQPVTLAIGSERGWTDAEMELLGERGFETRSLGKRILKTETASVTAVAIVLSALGLM